MLTQGLKKYGRILVVVLTVAMLLSLAAAGLADPATLKVAFEGGEPDLQYTGEQITVPGILFTDGDENTVSLVQGTDYTLSCSPAPVQDAGPYTLTINVTNEAYALSSNTLTFTVRQATVTDIEWPAAANSIYYGDKLSTAGLTKTSDTKGTYTFADDDAAATACGTVKAAVTFTPDKNHVLDGGAESQTSEIDVTVNKKPIDSFTLENASRVYDGTEGGTLTPVVMAGGSQITEGIDVRFESNDVRNAGTYTVLLSMEGNPYYTEGTNNTASYVIEPATIASFELSAASSEYTGEPVAFASLVTNVRDGNGGEVPAEAYTVSPESGTDAQTYTIALSAEGNYKVAEGIAQPYEITKATITGLTLGVGTKVYDGQPITTDPSALNASIQVSNGKQVDYQLAVTEENKGDAGMYTVTVTTANPNYTVVEGVSADFEITKAKVGALSLTEAPGVYNGKAVDLAKLASTLTTDGGSLIEAKNYTLTSDSEVLNAGTYTISAELTDAGAVNYEIPAGQTVSAQYVVDKVAITSLTLQNAFKEFDGEVVAQADIGFIVKDANGADVPQDDYTVSLTQDSPAEIRAQGSYTFLVSANESSTNYKTVAGSEPTAVYRIGKAEITALTLTKTSSIYSNAEIPVSQIEHTVTASNGQTLVLGTDYDLMVQGTIKDAGDYTIALIPRNENYTGSPTATYTVTPAALSELTLGKTGSIYSQQEVTLDQLTPTLTAEGEDGVVLTVPSEAYDLTCDKPIQAAGEYTIAISLKDTRNYTGSPTATYTVTPATLTALTLEKAESIYSQQEVTLAQLVPTLTAEGEGGAVLTVPAEAYELTCDKAIQDAGEYTIAINLKDTVNYQGADAINAKYTVKPAALTALTLEKDESIYSQQEVTLAQLVPTLTAAGEGDAVLTVPTDAYELKCDTAILEAGEYTVTINLKDSVNYQGADAINAKYTVKPATLSALTLEKAASVYNQQEIALTDLVPTLQAVCEAETPLTVPAEAYELTCEKAIKDVGEYTIQVTLKDTKNYQDTEAKVSAVYTVTKATLSALTLEKAESIYSQEEVTLTSLVPTLKAVGEGGETLTVPAEAYELACETAIKDVGEYTITVTLLDEVNYQDAETKVSTVYTVTKATLSELTLTKVTSTYNQKEIDPESLKQSLTATCEKEAALTVPTDAYRLVCDETIKDVKDGGYTIKVELIDSKNYQDTAEGVSVNYTVTPATLSELTLSRNTSVYNQKEIAPADVKLTLKAACDEEEPLTVPAEAYELVCEDTIMDVKDGGYTIKVSLIDKTNYQDPDGVSAIYTVTPATIVRMQFAPAHEQYKVSKEAFDVDTELRGYGLVVNATANEGEELVVPGTSYVLNCDETMQQVGSYTVYLTLPGSEKNYVIQDGGVSTGFEIWRRPVQKIEITVNGPEQDATRLGGDDEAKHHTIQVDAEPDEAFTAVITRLDGSEVITLNGTVAKGTPYIITIAGDAINGKALNSGSEEGYTITVSYDDASNLTNLADGAELSAASPAAETVSSPFIYDREVKTPTVYPLMNRGADGVTMDLPENYSSVTFASGSKAGVPFAGGRQGFVTAGGGVVIPFNANQNKKLFSTAHSRGDYFTVDYTDYVGNTGTTITGCEVLKADGVLAIEAVNPGINGAGRIGRTDKLTWTIKMTTAFGYNETVHLSVGNVGSTGDLPQGSSSVITTPTGRLTTDSLLNVSAVFDDLNGTAGFASFIYDSICDTPILTSTLYEGCYLLAGLVEPYSNVRLNFMDGSVRNVRADAYGMFVVASMPYVYEGDSVRVTVTDMADNYTTVTYRVQPEQDPVDMKAYMLGKNYVNAHNLREGQTAGWTSILTVTADELKSGFTLPIIAGNIVKIGEMTMKMDESGMISYTYQLEDDIELAKETVIANTTRDIEAAIWLQGSVISPTGTYVAPNRQNTFYVTAQFDVKVPADRLETTFQTEKVADNELKAIYRDRQNNKRMK